MNIEANKQLYREIMQTARETSRLRGSNQILPGTVRDAARQKHQALGVFEDFEKWWSRVHTIGLRPISKSTNGVTPKPSKNEEKTFKGKFRNLVMQYDILPPDEFLAAEWGGDERTAGRRRSELKKEGFGFELRDGVYHVTKRPTPVKQTQPEPKPSPLTEPDWLKEVPQPAAAIQGVLLESVPNTSITDKLDEITRLLRELVGIWK